MTQNPWDFSEYSETTAQGNGGAHGGQQAPPQAPFAPAQQGAGGPQQPPFGGQPDSGGVFGGNVPGAPSPVTMFGTEAEPPQQLVTSAPPIHWLAVAAGLAVIGIVLALVLGGLPPVAIVAWVLAGPVAIGVLALFTTTDLKARSGAVYAAQGWVKPAYWVALVLCFIGTMAAAWKIAEWVGRL
ncbi:hypothetical protein ACQBAU_15950 [Propionibacteriaceae bacterium Y2011]|uniref:hypothetical protein n=1 Tax=Microlunatus sp. Y2014 TaxID=3418488 RepID=UPI003B47D6A2